LELGKLPRRYFKKHIDPNQFPPIQEPTGPLDLGTDIELGQYERRECAIAFFDLVNFTNISWSLNINQVMTIIQPLFQKISVEINSHEGMIDKFPGDGVVGFWPRNHLVNENKIVDNALDTATKIMFWFYNEFRPKITLPKPSHTLELCVGIDAGSISIAHVGTPIHSELILLGDQVNCASKCQACAEKKEIVIGQDARDMIYYNAFYNQFMSTGPHTGVVYTDGNRQYLSYRFDWEAYCKRHSFVTLL
jgi:class 3 adenylate cyclase